MSCENLLIIVDMVNGFIREGKMADKGIENVIPNQIELIKNFVSNGEKIIAFKDTHNKDCREFKIFPEHCVEGTTESELVDELKQYKSSMDLYNKNSTCGIFVNGFMQAIENMKELKKVIIVGCCTDICVLNLAIPLQNYFCQNNRNVDILIPKNAVETYDAPNHKREEYNDIAFRLMAQAGISIVESI